MRAIVLVLVLGALGAAGCQKTCAIPGGPVVPCKGDACGTCTDAGCICPVGAVVYKQAQEEIGRWLEENRLPGYPLFYTASARFLNGSEPSSERGSLARMQITLSNYPHAVFGVVATNFYELSEAAADEQPDYYQRMKLGGIDDAQTIHVSLTQQNVTQTPAPQNVFSGGTGNVWRPWPTIYWFRAANQVVIEARRLVRYPSILLDSGARFVPLPEIHVTMVTAQLNSDYFPGLMPGSTGRP